ncbi:afadin-like [Mercenaria mercenaria]|uniref:afadin-like n=1 Tax=Mercenaria mercenaria TaxID=6596 RepID=UPI00234F4935|nr:afadin-like [Mercenaria mercenaria]
MTPQLAERYNIEGQNLVHFVCNKCRGWTGYGFIEEKMVVAIFYDLQLKLFGPNIQLRHCVIAHTSGIVTVTPTSRESETYVNNQRVHETTLLQHGMTVKFGKQNAFRFFDPSWEGKQRKGQMPQELAQKQATAPPFPNRPQETNFDMDGRVETMTDGSRPNHPQRQESRQSAHSSLQGSSMQGSIHDDVPRGSPRDSRPDGTKFEDALPASLEFRDDKENDFLSTVILDTNASATQFKLSPTYTMYLAVRFRLSSAYRPEPSDPSVHQIEHTN